RKLLGPQTRPSRSPSPKNLSLAALGLYQPATPTVAPAPPPAPAPNQPLRLNAMSQANEEQMHRVCEHLDGIPDFDGSEKKETEAVWRRKFENQVDPYGPSGVQKAALWKGKVDADSIAQDWLDTMPQSDIDMWMKLVAELLKCWPGQSMVEKAKVKIDNWYAHAFDEVKVVEMVEGTGGKMEVYYEVWARQHMMLVTTLGGDEPSKLHYTWSRVIPPALKEVLWKGLNDYTTVLGLCSDIIGLEMSRPSKESWLRAT
ncbi:hypothetical protein FRC10_005230, partial [Ceratobasidium sp. 414]